MVSCSLELGFVPVVADTFNRRISKTVDGEKTEFIWQGNRLIAESRQNDKVWQSYIYEPDSFRPLALVEGHAKKSTKTRTFWYQNDQLGSPIKLTDSLGDTVYECEYNAYGQLTEERWPLADNHIKPINPLRLPGQYFDEESGLHYNLNRYYDPGTGRYITQDPLGIVGGLNPYQYCQNPVNWIDPLGLFNVSSNGFEGGAAVQTDKLAAQAQQELINEINKFKSNTQAERVAAMIGAYDPVTGKTAIGYSNKLIIAESLNPTTVSYIEKQLGVKIGEFTSFCKNKVGACAEVSAADSLIRQGVKPENIHFTQAIRPKLFRQENGTISEKVIVETCNNCKVTWPRGTK